MKKQIYILGILVSLTNYIYGQGISFTTGGSIPDGDALVHINNLSASSSDSSIMRIENQQNGANNVTGLQFSNSLTGATATWNMYIPASGSTDLRINNNGSDHVTIQNDGDVGVGTTSPVSGLDIQTSMGLAYTTITGATILDNTHHVVFCNNGIYIVSLPAANTCSGRVYKIKNTNTNGDDITIDGNGSETIDGSTTYVLEDYNQEITIISDGTNWQIISNSN